MWGARCSKLLFNAPIGITVTVMLAPLDLPCQPVRFSAAGVADSIIGYLKRMTPYCPFIEPSEKAGCLYASQVTLDCRTTEEIHPRMFEQIVPAVERFRARRRELADKSDRLLFSHTIVFHFPPQFDAEANRLMAWPNWLGFLMKDLYTPKAIVFGFIRKGFAERSSAGATMPVSPFHAVVIRSRVIGADHRFFAGNENLLSALAEADDDGGDVHAELLSGVPDIRDPAAIRAADYFHRLRALATERFRK
jgi:hypothetical protein